MGLVWAAVVHAASLQDREGAKQVLAGVQGRLPRLRHIWADGGYAGRLVQWAQRVGPWTLEIVGRRKDIQGFHVLPRRWVVERTFAWLGKYRRLSKDDEYRTESSEALIYVAMIHLMVRRLARARAPSPIEPWFSDTLLEPQCQLLSGFLGLPLLSRFHNRQTTPWQSHPGFVLFSLRTKRIRDEGKPFYAIKQYPGATGVATMIHSGFASRTPKSASAKVVLIIGTLVFVPYVILLIAMPVADQLPSIVRIPLSTMGLWLFLLSWLVLGRLTGYLLFTFGLLALLVWAFTRPLNWRQKIMLGAVGVALVFFVFSPYRPPISSTGDEQMLVLTEPPPWFRGLRNAQVFGEMTSCQYTILGWSGPTLLYRAECSGKRSQVWQFTPNVSEEPTLYVENLPDTLHKQQLDRHILLSHLYAPGVYPPSEEYAVRSLFVPDAPLVSPDGNWVAFVTRRPYSVQDVMVMRIPEDEGTDSSQ